MDIVAVIVVVIICVQVVFFSLNLKRMFQFKNIFSKPNSWVIEKDFHTGFVSGIAGTGNAIFVGIVNSINKYLSNNKGSVIDFNLLKDAVDRHCDSVEDDINTQTPVPLYCGLAGTMAGVIIGLVPLIKSGALLYLLNGGMPQEFMELVNNGSMKVEEAKAALDVMAASGINDLLKGVAWAMFASICGIILTTLNSMLFKTYKLKEESGKNTFLAWMQSELLPELPTDTSDALTELVKNLNKFNATFANNANQLDTTLARVNAVYHEQDEIIQAVHDMDVMKMAKANVRVLQELQNCTDKLALFNVYLSNIQGYTETIQKFNEQFNSEADRLHVLEEIRDFFNRHKAEISKEVASSDNALKTAIKSLNSATEEGITELKTRLTQQSDEFRGIIKDERQMFTELCQDMRATYSAQMGLLPDIAKRLESLKDIPSSIDNLLKEIRSTNKQMAENIQRDVRSATAKMNGINTSYGGGNSDVEVPELMPAWMKYSILIATIIIAVACAGNTIYNIWLQPSPQAEMHIPIDSNVNEIMIDTLNSSSSFDSVTAQIVNGEE